MYTYVHWNLYIFIYICIHKYTAKKAMPVLSAKASAFVPSFSAAPFVPMGGMFVYVYIYMYVYMCILFIFLYT
jgi:hypothetical protein